MDLEVISSEGAVCFAVMDRGIGIDQKDHEKIFESFRQVDEGINRKFGGTGLGLSITRNLVELHEGRIWVESELGKGSAFFVRIPNRQTESVASSPKRLFE